MASPILVTGGTGTLGSHVVRILTDAGQRVRVLSRKGRTATSSVEYVVGDLIKGTGVESAVEGVDVIVHCASAPNGDLEATRNLVAAAKARSTLPHLVYISIVGLDGIGFRFGYVGTKLAADKVVMDSGLPLSTQRARQFYDFVLGGAKSMARLPVVVAPKDFLVQPINPAEVAESLAAIALGPPQGRVPDIGGPEVSTWAEMVRVYLRAVGRRRPVVEVPLPGTRAIRSGGLLLQDPASVRGRQTWEEFLAERFSSTAGAARTA